MEEVMSQEPESVAINLLFSFINPKFEMILERAAEENSFCSSKPILNCPSGVQEFERGIATWLNAALEPLISRYLLICKTA